jgi:hypothetical protein
MKTLSVIFVLISFVFSFVAHAQPQINVSLIKKKPASSDIHIRITESDGKQLDYQTLLIKLNEMDIPEPDFDSMTTRVLKPYLIDFTLHKIALPNIANMRISISNNEGELGVFENAFIDNDLNRQSARANAKINWSSIWNTAKKWAARGIANSVIKAYLESKGYRCPPGPWFLCARTAS